MPRSKQWCSAILLPPANSPKPLSRGNLSPHSGLAIVTFEQKIIAEGRRYAKAQHVRIEKQRELIRQLEAAGGDTGVVRIEKDNLKAMVQSLDKVLTRLR